jgi:RimJ/RimL family protein N-acetyltransferase
MSRVNPVDLIDDQVRLRQARPDDAEAITTACQDPETQRWIPVPVPYETKHAQEWIAARAGAWAEDQELNWIVTDADDRLLGTVALHPHDETMREIGFWTAPWARGQGVTTAACRLVCRWAFEELHLERVEWWAAVGNIGSRKVAERLGFSIEGTCRKRLLHRGERQDAWVGGVLRGELTDS